MKTQIDHAFDLLEETPSENGYSVKQIHQAIHTLLNNSKTTKEVYNKLLNADYPHWKTNYIASVMLNFTKRKYPRFTRTLINKKFHYKRHS